MADVGSINNKDAGYVPPSMEQVPLVRGNANQGFLANWYLVLIAVVICNSAFLFGYNSAVLNGPTSVVNNQTAIHFNSNMLETKQIETATGIALGGAMLGALGANVPVDRFGRRWVLIGNNIFYLAGSTICATAVNYAMLLVGRFVVGVGFGIASVVVPQLLGEISPKNIRGILTSMNQLAVTLGLLVTNLVWFGFENVSYGWQWTIWLSLIPAIIQILCFGLVPESPQWLVQRGRVAEATSTLQRLRPRGWDVSVEMEEIEDALKLASANQGSWKELFAFKRVVIIGIGAMAIQQLTGINAVMYYSSTIFGFAGVENKSAATIGVMALNVGMTIFSLWLIDRLGRKPLLLGGISVMVISLIVAGLALIVLNNASPKLQGTLCVIMVLLYVAGFAVGLGAVLWPILSEIFPSEIRSKGMSFCLALNWTFNLILSLSILSIIDFFGDFYDYSPSVNEKYGAGWVFIVFAVISIISLFFVYSMIPETKGKSLDQIQRMLKGELVYDDDKLGEFGR